MLTKIIPNEKGHRPGKLVDAELRVDAGPLRGLTVRGFGATALGHRRASSPK